MATLQAKFLLIKYWNVILQTKITYHLRLFAKTICKRETEPSVKIDKNLLRMMTGTSTGVNKFYGK
ncbi:MAG: hypothetical protein AAF349_15030 [Cyanobacteria bacterium P01_A01_bin.68]